MKTHDKMSKIFIELKHAWQRCNSVWQTISYSNKIAFVQVITVQNKPHEFGVLQCVEVQKR